jgi:hypothetical protein
MGKSLGISVPCAILIINGVPFQQAGKFSLKLETFTSVMKMTHGLRLLSVHSIPQVKFFSIGTFPAGK